MTDPLTGKSTGWISLFIKMLPLSSILSVLITAIFIGLGVMFGDTIREKLNIASAEDISQISIALNEIHDQLDLLKRQVAIAARPDSVSQFIVPPTPTEGFCVAGEECRFSVLIERDERALSCKLVPGATHLVMTVDSVEYTAAVSRPRGQNVGPRPTGAEPKFDIPLNIPKGAVLGQIVTEYVDCDWQVDGVPPTILESPFFEFEIR